MQLLSALEQYALARSLSRGAEYQMRRSVILYSLYRRRTTTVDDLEPEAVSRWLQHLQETHSQRTVAGHRANVLALWRDLANRELVAPPNRVRRVSRPDPCPVAWTLDELESVLRQCEQLRGTFRSRPASRSVYCRTLVLSAYDTGLRRSDLWRLRREQIRPDGSIVLRQQKTGRTHCPRLRDCALEGIHELPGDVPLQCPYSSASDWYRWWKSAVIGPAGVRPGALQQIRRTGATHLAVSHPEAVQRYLGHRTPQMSRHYVDESLSDPQQYLPPRVRG